MAGTNRMLFLISVFYAPLSPAMMRSGTFLLFSQRRMINTIKVRSWNETL